MALGFTTKVSNPGTLPASTGNGVDFSPDGAFIAVAHVTTPFISVYPWSGAGFGAKVANPGTLPAGNGQHVAFSPAGDFIAIAHSSSPFISVYPWSGSGFGTKVADPASLPPNFCLGVAWSPDGTWIAVSHSSSPYVSVYPWSAGFGTKVADPGTLPAGTVGNAVAWSPDGAFIGVAHDGSPYVSVYPWSAGFGTKVGNPASLPGATGNAVTWSPDGAFIAVGSASATRMNVYPWSGTFGTKVADPGTVPSGSVRAMAFSSGSDYIAAASNSSPFVLVYPWSGAGFGTKVANPASLPPNFCVDVTFSPTTAVAVGHSSTPFTTAYAEALTNAPAGRAPGTGQALNPTGDSSTNKLAPAGLVTASGTSFGLSSSVKAPEGRASGTGAAFSASAQYALVNAERALGVGQAYNPARHQPRAVTLTVPTGNPGYPFYLFSGQVITPSVERQGTTLILTLACSDYNRLWTLEKVGAPVIGVLDTLPDGTVVAIDPYARNFGLGDGGVFVYVTDHYFPVPLDLVTHVHQTNPDYAFDPQVDYRIALSDLKAFLDEFASRQTGSVRYWVDADKAGHWTTVGPTPFETDFRVAAPFEINQDGAIEASANVIQAMALSGSPDHSNLVWRVFVRGGTPASSLWVYNDPALANRFMGEGYVDAPGAIDAATGQAIGEWHLRWNYRTLITGSAHISSRPEHHDGWRVGQSVIVTDSVLSRLESLPLDRYEAIITSVAGRLVSPGPGIGISIVGPGDITDRVTRVSALTWNEKGFGEVGTMNLTIEITDPDETINILPLTEIRAWTNGQAEIEYDLEWGDIPGGNLSGQLAKEKTDAQARYQPPVYKVVFTSDQTLVSILKWADYIGQLCSVSGVPEPVSQVRVAVELLQWSDLPETTVGTGFVLDDTRTDIGNYTTDNSGRIYIRVLRLDTGDSVVVYPKGQALPV